MLQCCSCSGCPAPSICTRARSWGCRRSWTFPTRRGRIPCGSDRTVARSAGTAAECRFPGATPGQCSGFSRDGATPWLPQPPSFGEYAASRQENDPDSTLSLYRDALALRRKLLPGVPAPLEWLPTGDREDVVAYRRGRVAVVCVFGAEGFVVSDAWGEVVISSASVDGRKLPGSGAAWLAT